MAVKSKKIVKIKLISQGKNEKGKPTGTFYTTTKNTTPKVAKMTKNSDSKASTKSTSGKLSKKKFDRRAFNIETGKSGMHVVFEEGKIK